MRRSMFIFAILCCASACATQAQTDRMTSKQVRHIQFIMEYALGEVAPDKGGAQRMIDQADDFKDELVELIRRHTANAFATAREILGNDFIDPEEIAAARGLSYSEAQIVELERTLPDRETLEWLKQNDYYLVAGSPRPMSLLSVQEINRSYFYWKTESRYANEAEAFARTEKVTCRWYMLRRGLMPNSTSKTWSEQQELLSNRVTAPTAVELIWGMTVYKAVRSIYLLGSVYARTSSVDSDGYPVTAGFFGGNGLHFFNWNDTIRVGYLGVASTLKP